MNKLRFVGRIVAGGLLGALLVSVAVHLALTIPHPRIVEDGQYGMIFMGTAPLGWLLGSLAGSAVALRARAAARTGRDWAAAGLLVGGGVLLGPWLGLAGVRTLSGLWLLFHPNG